MSESPRQEPLTDGWAMRQLTGFLTIFNTFDTENAATVCLVQRAADALEADGAALIEGGNLVAVGGPSARELALADLRAIASGRRDQVALSVGSAHAVAVPASEIDGGSLVVVRASAPLAPPEIDLMRAVGRVVALGRRTYGLVEVERNLRADSETQAAENARLLEALRGRQVLLERLGKVQRAIVAQDPLHEIYDRLMASAVDLIGDPVAILRLRDADGSDRSAVVAARGLRSDPITGGTSRSEDPGVGARAMMEGRLIVHDKATDPLVREIPGLWRREGLHAGMAAPVFQGSYVMGSVSVASKDPNRSYTPRDQQALLALAEHTSLALNHARAIDDAAHKAFHDSLTGLPNRVLFLDRLSGAAARAERSASPVAVLFIDIDDFKTINDSLGHTAGDELLRAVAERLASCLRPADTIARLGGDEFAVLIEDIDDSAAAANAASRMLESLAQPVSLSGREVYVSASVGIAAGTENAENLLRDADLAMYRAKAEGKGRYRAYAPHMHADIVERMELDVDLKRAIDQNELELHYQPIFDLKGGQISGLEALVRWNHPTRGFMSPARFIPLAEASGRIHDLGRWVLATACHQAALWRARYPSAGINVGVNLSAAQLQDEEIVDHVADALRRARLDPEGLTLEVTETALMEDLDGAIARLGRLKALGIDIAVDDFGVGHSSLVYLKKLPLDNLKIAQPFVEEIGNPDPDPPILRAILDLASVFGLSAVAEGIERPDQEVHLRELGCELGQGHHLAMPLTVDDADDLILRLGLAAGQTPVIVEDDSATPGPLTQLSPEKSPDGPATTG